MVSATCNTALSAVQRKQTSRERNANMRQILKMCTVASVVSSSSSSSFNFFSGISLKYFLNSLYFVIKVEFRFKNAQAVRALLPRAFSEFEVENER